MYLNRNDFKKVYDAALDAGLGDQQRRSLLLAWMPSAVVHHLPNDQSSPAEQLSSDLTRLNNSMESAEPLITWLTNAAGLVSYLPSKKALFEQTAQRLAGKPSVSAEPPQEAPPSQTSGPLMIQFFSASPKDYEGLQYGRELEQLRGQLQRHQGWLKLGSLHLATTKSRFQRCLRDHSPTIIHLSCHGDGTHLALQDAYGRADLLDVTKMARVLNTISKWQRAQNRTPARLFFINACKSHLLAKQVIEEVEGLDFAIGTKGVVKDDSAVVFADEFYSALNGALQLAFDSACDRVSIEKYPEDADLFTLHVRDGVDPMTVLIPQ